MESFVGKNLKTENGEEYTILNELDFKNLKCVYTKKADEDVNIYFQLSNDIEPTLIPIKSHKMISELNESLLRQTNKDKGPRKIEENESIQDYFAYLDDFYKRKIVTNI